MDSRHWVVGATFDGIDVLQEFFDNGYWYCWDANDFEDQVPTGGNSIGNQQQRFKDVKTGDYIAVKRMLGKAQQIWRF